MTRFTDTIKKWAKDNNFEERVKDLYPIFESFDERSDLFNILQNDAKESDNAAKQNLENQYLRRTMVRTHFAMIEGLLNVLNQAVLDVHQGGFIQLSAQEIEKLTETRTNKKGDLIPDFMPINKKMIFSFAVHSKQLGGFDYLIDTTSDSWHQFEEAVHIRNRLMHPRKLDDMILDNKEISLILQVTSWFLTLFTDLQRKVGDATHKRTIENIIKARIKGIQAGK